jgi:ribosomal protein S18 acetylase RimI-like enzyme
MTTTGLEAEAAVAPPIDRSEAIRSAFAAHWPQRPAGLALRDEAEADLDFLHALYGTTRADELAQVDWPDAAKADFVAHQFTAQRSQYRQHYPQAAFLVIEQDGERIGRCYLHYARAELRLMDVTLLPARRGQGLGTALMHRLLAWGDALGLPVTLHVEPFNPAQRLYRRLGFETLEVRGVYHFMQRAPAPAAEVS